jgi:lipid II:glycine glycyltransferase (peptidoglycan interpeptide bridge formation enzyme)
MLELCTHQFLFFKRKEFWFYDSEIISLGTYNVFCYSNEKEAGLKSNVLIEQTSLIDLTKDEDELFCKINRTFKYHIKKAERIGITIDIAYSPTAEKCVEIINEFSVFAKTRNIEWNPGRISALQKINKLIVSEAFLNKEKIVTHIYLHDTKRVVLLHSYSQLHVSDKTRQGYANKFLHWQDIIGFKNHGLKLYDFGGINRKKHPGISNFKLAFGGNIIDCFSYIRVHPVLALPINFYKKIRT